MPCGRGPLVVTVTARTEGSAVAGASETDGAGHFSMRLVGGVYTVTAGSGSTLPRRETQRITVRPSATAIADIHCDTGIR